ncbi:MAG TPA: DegT/DnrJ/EryC1/StrS family aminotransferase [Anaerolineaceae bacterium]|nr:DegT/DnrJ/EryC1/StrS family aminotransferase [Anaerolineaceae bacterium]
MYYLLFPCLEKRQRYIEYLKEHGILSVFHYLPLHLSDMGQKFGGKEGDCPVTEEMSERLVRLPFFVSLTAAEQEQIIQHTIQFSV